MQAHHSFFELWPWVDLDLFYAKVMFGHLSFCMGKMKIIYFLKTIAAYDLKLRRCIVSYDPTWISKVKVILWPLPKVTQFSNLPVNHFFFYQKLLSYLKPNTGTMWKILGAQKWKFIQMGLVSWPRWLPRPYMVKKNLQKASFPKSVGQLQWNLVCSIGDADPS